MAAKQGGARDKAGHPQRMRLVPPRPGEIERRTRGARDARNWTRGLRTTQRRRLIMVLGNLLLLGLLLGLPFVRGQRRAQATERAHAAFLGCLYGAPVTGGLGPLTGEAEYFAAQLAQLRPAANQAAPHEQKTWPARCAQLLGTIASEPALFVLPSLKAAEARVREAVQILRAELAQAAAYAPGLRMPDRPLRALALLRTTIRGQLLQASLNAEQVDLPAGLVRGTRLPLPARLPVYAAPDATLSLWGDDQTLSVLALDATGVSYLEVQPGKPFSRARLVRPGLLRALLRFDAQSWLVWATPPARCADRGDGCFGKTMRVARAPSALLELPSARTLAAHLAGRADRSLSPHGAGLVIAARAAGGQSSVQEFALPADFATAAELPALSASRTWAGVFDEAVVLSAFGEAFVLGVTRTGTRSELAHVSASSTRPLTSLTGDTPAWLTACAKDTRATFAFGDGQRVRLGALSRTREGFSTEIYPELLLSAAAVVDAERPQRDRAVTLCTDDGALLLAREADDQLTAIVCSEPSAPCHKLAVAAHVKHFSALPTPHGALVAYAGEEAAQVRVRNIAVRDATLGPERIPAACWAKSGLCARPLLARVGSRVLLVAPEKTDLLALESADEGSSWSAPPVL